jgi:hypothetical protein
MADDFAVDKIDPKIYELLADLTEKKARIETDLQDLYDLKDGVSAIFPKDMDYKHKFIMEEKVKTTTSFFSTILTMNQEINKLILQEIEVRRKLSAAGGDEELGVRDIVARLESEGLKVSTKD